MPQQKSTSFSAAKVANFGVVMAEMVLEMGDLRKEVKRLRHHVSVLSVTILHRCGYLFNR